MVTLFAIPKPFKGHVGVIQMNALRSWVRLGAPCEVILLGDEPGTAEAATQFGVRHIRKVECNEYGTPLLSSVFATAQEAATYHVMCYVNADVMFLPDLLDAVGRVLQAKWPALLIGQRWDVELREPWDCNTASSEQQLRAYVRTHGHLHAPGAMDYFVFRRGFWQDIPPFAIGRTLWDNWLVYRARMLHVPVIDLSPVVMAIHQNHTYEHVPQGTQQVFHGPEAQRNFQLLGGLNAVFHIHDATWVLSATGLRPALGRRYLYRRFRACLIFNTYLLFLVIPLRSVLRILKSALRALYATSTTRIL